VAGHPGGLQATGAFVTRTPRGAACVCQNLARGGRLPPLTFANSIAEYASACDGSWRHARSVQLPALSPILILTFGASVALQVFALALLPATGGFTKPLPTAVLLVSFAFGIGLLSRLTAAGAPLSLLIPIQAALLPLSLVLIGVFVHHEAASPLRVGLLLIACAIVGVASTL
jgi:quaternary ammonium compound-resistance protein SugE